jgi:Fe-S oxidoreductase
LQRTTDAFRAALDAGKTIVGLEPSCTLMFRDEAVNLIPEWSEQHGAQILTFAEYIMQNPPAGLDMSGLDVLVHGHCHQKAMGVAQHTVDAVKNVLGANAQMIDSSCCGMAGSFGYQAETAEVSRQMAELSLAPTVRAAPKDTVVLADGFSCRCQIKDVTERKAMNLALLMDKALQDHVANH